MGIEEVKADLGNGQRSNRYRLYMNLPNLVSGDGGAVNALVKSTNIPSKTVGVIDVFKRGRVLKIAGDTTFDTWTCTFHNTEEMDVHSTMLEWSNVADNFSADEGASSPVDYLAQINIATLDLRNNEGKTYTLYNVFPTDVSEIEFNDETADTISEFSVTFTLSHWD